MAAADPYDRTVPAEAWVNGRPTTIKAVVHCDQVTLLAARDIRIELEASVWRLFAMHIFVRMALLCGRARRTGGSRAPTAPGPGPGR